MTVRPAFTATTDRLFNSLPEFMRDADEQLDWPLLRFVSLIGDGADDVVVMKDRFAYTPPDEGGEPGDTSDLTDPATADARWLPWLARLTGVQLRDLSVADQRAAIAAATTGVSSGSRASIIAAARTVLTGSKYVDVRPHHNGDPFLIGVVTQDSETPGGAQSVLDAIEAAGVTPAGFEVVYTSYAASWDTLTASYPTWGAVEASGSWTAMETQQ